MTLIRWRPAPDGHPVPVGPDNPLPVAAILNVGDVQVDMSGLEARVDETNVRLGVVEVGSLAELLDAIRVLVAGRTTPADTQLVAGEVDVGNFPDFPASQTVDGTVAVSNHPADFPDATTQAHLLAVRQQTFSPQRQAFSLGKVFIAGARHSLAANERAYWQIVNPAGSGHLLYVTSFAVWVAGDASRVRFHRHDTSIGTPVTPFEANRANVQPSTTLFTSANNGASNPPGTNLEIETRAHPSDHYEFDGTLLIPPGEGYLMWVQAPGGLVGSNDVAGSAQYYEQAL